MYSANLDNLIDKLFDTNLPSYSYTKYATNTTDYDVKQLEDGKQQLTLSVLGHDVKNIKFY